MTELDKLNAYVKQYQEYNGSDPSDLLDMHQQITTLIYFIELKRIDSQDEYNAFVFQKIGEGDSASKARSIADHQKPTPYRLRKIIEASKDVADSIRSRISYVKTEMNNNIQ